MAAFYILFYFSDMSVFLFCLFCFSSFFHYSSLFSFSCSLLPLSPFPASLVFVPLPSPLIPYPLEKILPCVESLHYSSLIRIRWLALSSLRALVCFSTVARQVLLFFFYFQHF